MSKKNTSQNLSPASDHPPAESPSEGSDHSSGLAPVRAHTLGQRPWLWLLIPAIALTGLCLVLWQTSTPTVVETPAAVVAPGGSDLIEPDPLKPLNELEASAVGINGDVVPLSQTVVVNARKTSGQVLLRARLRPYVSVAGKSPLKGTVARVHVRAGQFVEVNDRVLQISTGPRRRGPTRAERAATYAEAAQVEAVNQQMALQQRMQRAQTRLIESQQRVTAARRRVEEARNIVQKLQRGEEVVVPGAMRQVAPAREQPRQRATRGTDSTDAKTAAARRAAETEAKNAQDWQRAAERASDKASSARRAAEEAEAEVRLKQRKQQEARTALQRAQERTQNLSSDNNAATASAEGKDTRSSNVEAAKANLAEAEAAVKAATANAAAARREANAHRIAADRLQAVARQASERATASLKNLQVFADETPAQPERRSEKDTVAQTGEAPGAERTTTSLSIADAARLVRAAVEESSAAARQAQRVKNEVDRYERQVNATKNRLDATGEDLEQAQERMVDHMIRVGLSSVRAPVSGIVLSVAPIASEVSEGETLITIGYPDRLGVRLVDSSGAWRSLKPDMLLPVVVLRDDQPSPNGARSSAVSTSPRGERVLSGQGRSSPQESILDGVATMARLRFIRPPSKPGAPAVLRAVVYNPLLERPTAKGRTRRERQFRERQFQEGMKIVCSIDKPGQRSVMSIPGTAVMRDDKNTGKGLVAVLTPLPTTTNPVPATTNSATTKPVTTTVQDDQSGRAHRIEWRAVTLGPGNGVQQEIVSGLRPGERIALQPLALHRFAQNRGPNAAVRVASTS